MTPDDPRHGTSNGYGNLGCRCDPCREANRSVHEAYVKKVRETQQLTGPEFKHGTAYRYGVGCRCDECREGRNAKSRTDKRRRRQEELARRATESSD